MAETQPIDKIVKALVAVRSACATIPKSGFNAFHKYEYVTEADVSAHIEPLMSEHGLVLVPSLAGEGDGFTKPFIDDHGVTQAVFKYTLAHESGQVWPWPLYTLAHGDDHNSKGYGDKGAYKASTGAMKYTLLRLLMVATGDDPELTAKPEKEKPAPKEKTPKRLGKLAVAADARAVVLLDTAATDKIGKAPQDVESMSKAIRKTVAEFMGISGVPTDSLVDPLLSAIGSAELAPSGLVFVPGSPEEF
jgi:hypothetical protein